MSFRVGWEDEPMQAVEATGPHNLCLGTTIPKASHRLWAFGSGAYGSRSLPAQYSCLENSRDRGALQATVHGVAKSQT